MMRIAIFVFPGAEELDFIGAYEILTKKILSLQAVSHHLLT